MHPSNVCLLGPDASSVISLVASLTCVSSLVNPPENPRSMNTLRLPPDSDLFSVFICLPLRSSSNLPAKHVLLFSPSGSHGSVGNLLFFMGATSVNTEHNHYFLSN